MITALFDEGNVFYSRLFKIVWLEKTALLPHPAQVTFSVSKKAFRKAVTRNLLKRRLREVYRKQKSDFYQSLFSEKIQVIFIIIFMGKIVHDYITIENAMKEMLDKFIRIISARKIKC